MLKWVLEEDGKLFKHCSGISEGERVSMVALLLREDEVVVVLAVEILSLHFVDLYKLADDFDLIVVEQHKQGFKLVDAEEGKVPRSELELQVALEGVVERKHHVDMHEKLEGAFEDIVVGFDVRVSTSTERGRVDALIADLLQ